MAALPPDEPFHHLAVALNKLAQQGLERIRRRARENHHNDPKSELLLCSNDYLGYVTDRLLTPSLTLPSGAGASRLVAGNHAVHDALEQEVATWLQVEDALVFSSGYAANVGLLSALVEPADLIVSDALNHASIIDGCRLARGRTEVVPHGDVAAVERVLAAHQSAPGRRWVITESYFSMDGDVADLVAWRDVTRSYGASLLIDESHALGVFGPAGRGLCAERNVKPDGIVGTFGKALGGQGAFVAGSAVLTRWLWNRARSFVFSTGLAPVLADLNRQGVARAQADHGGRARLEALSQRVRRELIAAGYHVAENSRGPIIPLLVGDATQALALSDALAEHGVRVVAIRPPTVPVGTSRLRVTLHARLRDDEIERALAAFQAIGAVAPGSSSRPRSYPPRALPLGEPARAPLSSRVIVVGTGTEVGKTHVTVALVRYLRSIGVSVGVWKPIATGAATESDVGVIARALGQPDDPAAFAFADPVSPHLAAARHGERIDLAVIRAGADQRQTGTKTLWIETAGGLFSPLGEGRCNVDLVTELAPAVLLLVAPDRLGVLHDVTATLRAARFVPGLTIRTVVLSTPEVPDASTGTNAPELAALGITPVATTFPRAAYNDPATIEAARRCWESLTASSLAVFPFFDDGPTSDVPTRTDRPALALPGSFPGAAKY